MPIPANITDLSTTAGSNSPPGAESPTDGDGYLRAHASFIAILRDQLNGTSSTGTINDASFTGTMTGAATWSSLQTFSGGIAATDGTFSGDVVVGDDLTVTGDGTFGGNLVVTGTLSASNLVDGTYAPTLTNVSNVTSSSLSTAYYERSRSSVTVWGTITIDPASASTYTQVDISLPIASDLAAGELAGTAVQGTGTGIGTAGFVGGDTVNNRAMLGFTCSSDTASRNWAFHFSYRIV